MSVPTVHVVVVGDVDPLAVRSDALAQVIDQQLRRRADGVMLTTEFRTTQTADDPRGRSRWLPTTHGDWADRADAVVDTRASDTPLQPAPTGPVIVADLTGAAALFPEHLTAAALETRRLMLDHLGVDATTSDYALSATDHLALGSLDLGSLSDAERHDVSATFDRVGGEVGAVDANDRAHHEALRLEVERLRDELAASRRSWAKLEAASVERLEYAEGRIAELTERLEAMVLTTTAR